MTTIAWTSETWNPIRAVNRITGKVGWYCQKVSPGCKNCYAEAMNRYRGNGRKYDVRGGDDLHIGVNPDALARPLYWKKARKVFVCSMTDLFLEQHTDEMIAAVFGMMAACPQHTFQVLTKRPERMRAVLSALTLSEAFLRTALALDEDAFKAWHQRAVSPPWPLPNVWLGISAEDQERADERIPILLATPAVIRWVSYEPALGPIDFSGWLWGRSELCADCPKDVDCECGYRTRRDNGEPTLDWIVAGGESGRAARPFETQWALDVVEQCRGLGTAVFVKQMGSVVAKRDGYSDGKGEDPSEWASGLRIREYPAVSP